jgi:hypothetical protein
MLYNFFELQRVLHFINQPCCSRNFGILFDRRILATPAVVRTDGGALVRIFQNPGWSADRSDAFRI